MASYLPNSAIRGGKPAVGDGALPHSRATWAAGGRPLADGVEVVLHNPRLLHAASQLLDTQVIANRIGWIGDPVAAPPVLSAAAEISRSADGGWIISDTGRPPFATTTVTYASPFCGRLRSPPTLLLAGSARS